jgi:dsRNA-specific ribonuclease
MADSSKKRSVQDRDDVVVNIAPGGVETYVFDPYNPINTEITPGELSGLLLAYGIQIPVFNHNMYRRAFVHRSYVRLPDADNTASDVAIAPKPDNCVALYSRSNERLEFVGDGILECITKLYLYKRFPKENEGFMTEKKIALVKNEAIGKIAFEMGLHKWLIISKHAELKQTRVNFKKLGCLFEAFLGALFLDFNKVEVRDETGWFSNMFSCGPGFQMAQLFVENVFEKHVNWVELIRTDDNYKNILQVRIQKTFKVTPEYMEIRAHSFDHGYAMGVFLVMGQAVHDARVADAINVRTFTRFQDIHDHMHTHGKIILFIGEGTHKIKKKAEQIACEIALSNLDELT